MKYSSGATWGVPQSEMGVDTEGSRVCDLDSE